jgi:hypothetical protein
MIGQRLRVIVALADAFEGAAVYDGLFSAGRANVAFNGPRGCGCNASAAFRLIR